LVDPTLYHGVFYAMPRPCYGDTIAELRAEAQKSQTELPHLLQRFRA